MCEVDYNQITEILKASTPIVALLAMFFTPWFTARYNRKQKKRDELYSYKVKAYMKLAEASSLVLKDFSNGIKKVAGSELVPFDKEGYKGPLLILTYYEQVYFETNLFLSTESKLLAKTLQDTLMFSTMIDGIYAVRPAGEKQKRIVEQFGLIQKRSHELNQKLYQEIGLNKI